MSREKQIEEMAKIIDGLESNAYTIDFGDDAKADSEKIAEALYNAGYRKCVVIPEYTPSNGHADPVGALGTEGEDGCREQIVGEWILHNDGSGTCKNCNTHQKHIWDMDRWQNFCGHCGARMTKGGAE